MSLKLEELLTLHVNFGACGFSLTILQNVVASNLINTLNNCYYIAFFAALSTIFV